MNIQTKFYVYKYEGKLVQQYNPFFNLLKNDTLSEFRTDKISLSSNVQPIQINVQKSYDDSVNIIINDNQSNPKLINSRFSVQEDNKYTIEDRFGANDSNIYDEDKIVSQISLFKNYSKFSKIILKSVFNFGNLKVGNYVIYFKYSDADGNETNIVSESNMIPCFIGSNNRIDGGYADKNSFKSIKLLFKNIDTSYDYLYIYYSRYSSDQFQLTKTSIFKVLDPIPINNKSELEYILTGSENVQEITQSELNNDQECIKYCKTQTILNNRLFLGNLNKTYIDYEKLKDISLRFIGYSDAQYINSDDYDYSNPDVVYNYTGYWPNEYYRLGIIYIYNDNTQSPVFNISGTNNYTPSKNELEKLINSDFFKVYDEKTTKQLQIDYDDTTFKIKNKDYDFNVKGVIKTQNQNNDYLISIKIAIAHHQDVIKILNEQGIIGYFFVRQKRIPTILAQGYLLNKTKYSGLPLNQDNCLQTVTDSYGNILKSAYSANNYIDQNAGCLICPEYEVRQGYYNQIFNGSKFIIKETDAKNNYYACILIGVKDSIQSIIINTQSYSGFINREVKFSSKAGEPEDVKKVAYEYEKYSDFKQAHINKGIGNAVRGAFGPYVGVIFPSGFRPLKNYTIYVNGYTTTSEDEYLKIRYSDNSPYYAISNKYDLSNDLSNDNIYKGDCYICNFWHRLNRNFQDPSAPNNDEIVKTNGYSEVRFEDGAWKNFDKVNLGDINAVKLGEWIKTRVRCTCNLSIRSVDDTNSSEYALTGNPRAFYPYKDFDTSGNYKIPESQFVNEGFGQSLSQRIYFELSNVPWIRNRFTNQIIYSDIAINDGYKNGFRVFKVGNERNYNSEYGAITKLLNIESKMIIVFEHGICSLLLLDEKPNDSEINVSNILPEKLVVISDIYGSKWIDGVVQTPNGIYGIDTDAKRIWFYDGNSLNIISNNFVNSFLDKNITINSNEKNYNFVEEEKNPLKIISSYYNAHKSEIMFTYQTKDKSWNLCYSEILKRWTTFYSWIPYFCTNINNIMYSFNKDTKLYKHNVDAKPCYWYDEQHPFEFEFTVIDSPLTHKIFDNMIIVSNKTQPESFHYTITGDCYNFANQKEYMYFRQEATNSYLHNAEWPNDLKYNVIPDTTFISDKANNLNENPVQSVMFPNVYYSVDPNTNTLYDQWIEQTSEQGRNYAALSGTTLVRNGQEIHIQEHSPARDITNPKYGRSRGNMHYREDRWFIQISPINLLYRNEPQKVKDKYPYVVLSNLPQNVVQYAPKITNWKIDATLQKLGYNTNTIDFSDWGTLYNYQAKTRKEIKLKDKYIKIKVRYKGDKQAFIHSILTKYTEVL